MDTCMNGLRFARWLLLRCDNAVGFSPRTLFLPNGLLVLVLPLTDDPTTHSAAPGINTCMRTDVSDGDCFQNAQCVSGCCGVLGIEGITDGLCQGLSGVHTAYAKRLVDVRALLKRTPPNQPRSGCD